MVGPSVSYYVFSDSPANMSLVLLREPRQLVLLSVHSHDCWQDMSMNHIKAISIFSQ